MLYFAPVLKREQFIHYLLHPDQLQGESAVALNSLLKEFPYFQSAQLLYLKSLHNEKSIHYKSQLKIAAAYSANRKSLYFLINGEPTKKEIAEKREPEPPVKETEVLQTLEIQAQASIEPEVLQEPIQVFEEQQQMVKESAEIASPEVPIPLDEKPLPQVSEEVASKRIDLPEGNTNLEQFHTNLLADSLSATALNDLLAKEPAIPTKNEVELVSEVSQKDIERPDETKKEQHSFLEWLQLTQGKAIEPASIPVKETNPSPKAIEKRALIEKFITTEPRITPKKQEFYNPVNKARQSVMENDSIVSETLALVYVKQGNFQRALKSYEILSLKFPEKSTYFAAQILKIKELQEKK